MLALTAMHREFFYYELQQISETLNDKYYHNMPNYCPHSIIMQKLPRYVWYIILDCFVPLCKGNRPPNYII